MGIRFGREICGDLAQSGQREWIVTNGLGGFASGTIAGLLTRRYHGLLIASEHPPVGRVMLCPKIDETIAYRGRHFPLYVNRWTNGCIDPVGFTNIESFSLNRSIPQWRFAVADCLLDKNIFMLPHSNTTIINYTVARASEPLELSFKAFANYRDYHSLTHAGDWRMDVQLKKNGVQVLPHPTSAPFQIWASRGECVAQHDWYYDFELACEKERGLDAQEDHLHIATFRAKLKQGETVSLAISSEHDATLNFDEAYTARVVHETELLRLWDKARPKKAPTTPDWIQQLVMAADQFIVKRISIDAGDGTSVIAGYPWFSDWGRDSFISLSGLALVTGRQRVARSILSTFAHTTRDGLIPNRFPDSGQVPEYNSVDAALLFIEAAREYHEHTGDLRLLREIFPAIESIIHSYTIGTHFGIACDPSDGLLYAGQQGLQLTWMDAKIGDWVVTPRIGKPVEINALWYSALCAASGLAKDIGRSSTQFDALAKSVKKGFSRFWNRETESCFDVLDGPAGNDAAIRPNQLFAVYLPHSPLSLAQWKSVVGVCSSKLLTSHGLRSLAPDDTNYCGRYEGDQYARDAAYHQGTVWAWLIGPFVLAHLRAFKNPKIAAGFLEPFEHLISAYGVGTIGEIFDGDAPFKPRGCIAQAWSVAQVLKAWHAVTTFRQTRS